MATASVVKKIDSDTHFLPPIDTEEIRQFMPKSYPKEAIDMLLRDTSMFANPNARRGGFRATTEYRAIPVCHSIGVNVDHRVGHARPL